MYFRTYRLSQTWCDHSLKRAVSKHPSTVNMLKGPKNLLHLHESTLSYFSVSLRGNDFENNSLIEI